jgi:amidase
VVYGDRFTFGSSSPAAIAGYPILNVPMGIIFGLPVGMLFMASAFSEQTLIRLAPGFEHVTQARRQPQFLPLLPLTKGEPVGDRKPTRKGVRAKHL